MCRKQKSSYLQIFLFILKALPIKSICNSFLIRVNTVRKLCTKKNGQNKVKVVPIANNDIDVNEGGCLSTIYQVWLGLCCLINDFETVGCSH